MKITRLENCDKHQVQMEGVKGALKQVPLGKADGAPNFSVRVFTLEPGGYTPLHAHDAEHLNYVLQGRGQIMSDEGPRAISPGDFILVKPQERHQYRNTSDGPLVFMCMVPSDYE
jgi:quercetin dioxygenase-like cupin family protein